MLRRALLLSLCLSFLGGVGSVSAAFYDVSVSANDISFIPQDLIVGMGTKIYATITNNGERDVEGTVRFYDGETIIGAKAFSVRTGARPEDAWVGWTPQVYGDHTLRIVVDNDGAFTDASPANNTVALPIFVDRDTDGDGVPDQSDDDRDNDLVLNADEVARGTDPLRGDTDGDGVNDRLDVFPLDPLRSKPAVATPSSTRPGVQPSTASVRVTTPPTVQRRPTQASVQAPVVVPFRNTVSDAETLLQVSSPPEDVTTTLLDVASPSSTVSAEDAVLSPLEKPTSPTSSTRPSRELSAPSFSSLLLVVAAVLSAAGAGIFIWLGRRAD